MLGCPMKTLTRRTVGGAGLVALACVVALAGSPGCSSPTSSSPTTACQGISARVAFVDFWTAMLWMMDEEEDWKCELTDSDDRDRWKCTKCK